MATMEGEKKVEKEKVLPKDAQVSFSLLTGFLMPGFLVSCFLMACFLMLCFLMMCFMLPDGVLHASLWCSS